MLKLSRANPTLHLFSGEDREIIRKLNHLKINRNFNIIGFCVVVICAVCFVSAVIFSFNILSGIGKVASIPIGMFWGFAVTIIYVLLLYTISPPLLIDKKMFKAKTQGFEKSKKRWLLFLENSRNLWNWFTVSMLIRIFFITLFALITVQPFIVMMFSSLIEEDVELYKAHYKSEIILETDQTKIAKENEIVSDYIAKTHFNALAKTDSTELANNLQPILTKLQVDNSYLSHSLSLKSYIKNYKIKRKDKESYIIQLGQELDAEISSDEDYLNTSQDTRLYNKFEFETLLKSFNAVIQEKADNNNHIVKLIDENPFYIRRMIIIYSIVPAAHLVNGIALLLFLLPIFLKFQIRKINPKNKDQSFYYFKKEKEYQVVNKNYQTFKKKFEDNLQQRNHKTFIRVKNNLAPYIEKLREYKPKCAEKFEKETIERFYPYTNFSKQELISKYNYTEEQLASLEARNEVRFYEKYEDPPFNLKLKERKIVELSGQSIINEVWKDE